MAQDKTEEPTPKKLREARKRGEVAKSRELGTAAVLLGTAGALVASADHLLASMKSTFDLSLQSIAGGVAASPGAVLEAGFSLGASALAPVLLVAMAAGALASFLQVGPLVSLEPISPKPERLDPIRGTKNLFSQRQLIELVKSVAKIAVIGWVAWVTLRDGLHGIVGLVARDAHAALGAAGTMVTTLLLRVGAVAAGIAVLDVIYQRWRFRQDQKMTKEEVKREHKESEGDAHAKHERERMHREILEHSVLEQVRLADVLVVNPTHYAVALRYDEEENEAPEVLAKGQDDLAQRMIRAAQESGVPIMRDVPLAHALFDLEIGEEIPEALFEAVAAVLRAAWRERAEAEGEGA